MAKLTKDDMIQDIEGLWPPDCSDYGRDMLIQAICRAWRSLPEEVINELYNLEYWKEINNY